MLSPWRERMAGMREKSSKGGGAKWPDGHLGSVGTGGMTRRKKTCVVKPDNLNFVSETHMVYGENQLPHLTFHLYIRVTYTDACVCTYKEYIYKYVDIDDRQMYFLKS